MKEFFIGAAAFLNSCFSFVLQSEHTILIGRIRAILEPIM
jgi:hypothetical protein